MKLTLEGLKSRSEWEEKSYSLPDFDYESVKMETIKNPNWIHFGAGNIFRAFLAKVNQNNLNEKLTQKGIIAGSGRSYETIEKVYRPHDNLSILVTLKSTGEVEKTVIASVMESLAVEPDMKKDWMRLKEIFTNPGLQMVSFTITEKGYNLQDSNNNYFSDVQHDFKAGPEKTESYLGKIISLLYERYLAGKKPIAFVSMDNCSQNGTRLFNAVHDYARNWTEQGLAEEGFLEYVSDPNQVSFPWSMIDKITPRPDETVEEVLKTDGLEDLHTLKSKHFAPFVNAEKPQYLVIEDLFPNGRPIIDDKGVLFADRDTVDKVEKMKVCTCLNPLHTALAIFGCLLDYELISEEMKNPVLKKMVETIGYVEGLPVVVDPKIIKPKAFIDEVIGVRLPNPFMPDSPQRIATDTSQKISIRFGETIKAYRRDDSLDVNDLKIIPLVLAGWLRYLMGIKDNGERMELSPDPLLDELVEKLKEVTLGSGEDYIEKIKPILSNDKIFGIDLYKAGLGEKVESYFGELIASEGAVEKTLKKYL